MDAPLNPFHSVKARNSYKKQHFGTRKSTADFVPLFRDAIKLLFGTKKLTAEQIENYATIAAFLESYESQNLLWDIDPELKDQCHQKFRTTGKARFSEVLIEYLVPYGFASMQGVVLNGDATDSFSKIVGNRIIFKDGFSPIHGEFAHIIQWVSICKAADSGVLRLSVAKNEIASLYADAPGIKPGIPGLKLLGEFNGLRDFTLWDFVCDCFLDPTNQEDLLENLLTQSFRGPANIQAWIKANDASFLGTYYKKRYSARKRRVTPADASSPTIGNDDKWMQTYHGQKQAAKGSTHYVGNTWGPAELEKFLEQVED